MIIGNLIIILPDQISHNISALQNIDNSNDIVFCYEYLNLKYKHHPKKIAFLLSSMRHFQKELIENKYNVQTLKLQDITDFEYDIQVIIRNYPKHKIIITEPTCYNEFSIITRLSKNHNIEILEDNRFLANRDFFHKWAYGKKELRMEFFYREMRRKYNILIENSKPSGGKWNYDTENRKAINEDLDFLQRISHKKDKITIDVLEYVKSNFSNNFGDLLPFHYATNRNEATIELDQFIEKILPSFGNYQDAMVKDEPYLYHSLISSYLNNGLLEPLDVIKRAEKQYYLGKAPLNSVEGFIRQILGWREYIRGIYWLFMPEYKSKNFLAAKKELPSYYWGKKTNMFCMNQSIQHTKNHSYSHHIQRLMVTGNFGLLAGINPDALDKWYGEVYSDAFEWVHMPNTRGMSLYADGGIIASKPYAASGKYIDKMSNYCKNCKYNPKETISDNACPFNALYWHFINRHSSKFESNQRMKFVYASWFKMNEDKRKQIITKAQNLLEKIEEL